MPELLHSRRILELSGATAYFCAATDICDNMLIMPYAGKRIDKRIPKDTYGTMRHLLEGLATLHAAGIIHGDVNCANILVDDHEVARFIDFYRPTKGRLSSSSAPEERVLHTRTNKEVDCWRLGIVFRTVFGICHPVVSALLEPDPTKRASATEAIELLNLTTC